MSADASQEVGQAVLKNSILKSDEWKDVLPPDERGEDWATDFLTQERGIYAGDTQIAQNLRGDARLLESAFTGVGVVGGNQEATELVAYRLVGDMLSNAAQPMDGLSVDQLHQAGEVFGENYQEIITNGGLFANQEEANRFDTTLTGLMESARNSGMLHQSEQVVQTKYDQKAE